MATQRLTLATLAGESAVAVIALVRSWRSCPEPGAIDRFCAALRENALSLPIVYFCEWVDRWLMGDLVPGPKAVEGRQSEMTCLLPDEALEWAGRCGHQFPEQEWLASRFREAAACWGGDGVRAVVVVREVLGSSTTDEEVEASLGVVPEWLVACGTSAGQGDAADRAEA